MLAGCMDMFYVLEGGSGSSGDLKGCISGAHGHGLSKCEWHSSKNAEMDI